MKKEKQITDFLFEIGTMRKLMRAHRQTLLTDDMSDNIASHCYRVSMIGWFLAKMEVADPYKTVMMCLLHDMREARSGDHNWVHKKYVKVFEKEIREDQLGALPYGDLLNLVEEYDERKSKEAILAKDADMLDQLLLLREYDLRGNKEAGIWLYGEIKGGGKTKNVHLKKVKSTSARKLGKAIMTNGPSD